MFTVFSKFLVIRQFICYIEVVLGVLKEAKTLDISMIADFLLSATLSSALSICYG